MQDPLPERVAQPPDAHGVPDHSILDPQRRDIPEHHHQRDRYGLRQLHPLQGNHQVIHVRRAQDPRSHHRDRDQLQSVTPKILMITLRIGTCTYLKKALRQAITI